MFIGSVCEHKTCSISIHWFSWYDFPKPSLLSGRSVENREAKDRGQGAARDSPRCLTAPGMKTKTGDAQ